MNYSGVSLFHVGGAVLAIAAGMAVLAMPKGTRRHRFTGRAYVAAMITLNVSSLFIFSLTGRFSLFHAFALFSLATVIAGFLAVYRRRPREGWLDMHLQFMTWSYIGLVAAAASEAAVRLPDSPFWWAVALASLFVFAVGGLWLARKLPSLRARYGHLHGKGVRPL